MEIPVRPLSHESEEELIRRIRYSESEMTVQVDVELERGKANEDKECSMVPRFYIKNWCEAIESAIPECFSKTNTTKLIIAQMDLIKISNPFPVPFIVKLYDLNNVTVELQACTNGSIPAMEIFKNPMTKKDRLQWFGFLSSEDVLWPPEDEFDKSSQTMLIQTTQPMYWYAYSELQSWLKEKIEITKTWKKLPEYKGPHTNLKQQAKDRSSLPSGRRGIHHDWCHSGHAAIYSIPTKDALHIEKRMKAVLSNNHMNHQRLQTYSWTITMDPWDYEILTGILKTKSNSTQTLSWTVIIKYLHLDMDHLNPGHPSF